MLQNIPTERQRLIFQGKELKDTQLLAESDVNGKTIHLVQRLPPSQLSGTSESLSSSSTSASGSGSTRTQRHSDSSAMPQPPPFFSFFGGSGVGSGESLPPHHQHAGATTTTTTTNIANMPDFVQQLIGGLGELGQNATFNTNGGLGGGAAGQASGTGSGAGNMEVHIDLGNVSQLVNDNEIRTRVRNIRRLLGLAQSRLNRLEVRNLHTPACLEFHAFF